MILPHGKEALREAARRIGEGGLIAFRTDTFYGLGADPLKRDALTRLNSLKGRDGKPILLVLSTPLEAARFVAAESAAFKTLAERFWPGPLTLVAGARGDVPEEVTAGTGTVGVRLPGDFSVRELVAACGGALTATSANRAGEPPARTAREVENYFGAALPLIVDGGETAAQLPSTVVNVAGGRAILIREGVISAAELQSALRPRGIELKISEAV
jgi:L-threonylcarbamoyladenylate synthase